MDRHDSHRKLMNRMTSGIHHSRASWRKTLLNVVVFGRRSAHRIADESSAAISAGRTISRWTLPSVRDGRCTLRLLSTTQASDARVTHTNPPSTARYRAQKKSPNTVLGTGRAGCQEKASPPSVTTTINTDSQATAPS